MSFLTLSLPRNLSLLLLLTVLCFYTVLASVFAWLPIDGEYAVIALTTAHYIGFAAVASCFISCLWFRPYFNYALGSTLLLGLFNLAVFLPSTLSIGFSFGEVHIGINPLLLLLLFIYYLLNRSAVNTFIRKHLLPAPTPETSARQRRERIDQFKQTFKRKSDESLRQIILDNKLVPDAVAAARELLQEHDMLLN